ncbi:MAG: sulfite exporter TauE/SafE family protein [Clostridia bacterium]|nr:sulfite exporter TauE/SafE family protein [Clostridia bacterium]
MKPNENKGRDVVLTVLAILTLTFVLLQFVFHVDLLGGITEFAHTHGLQRPVITEGAGLGLIFLYGLLSSIHCVGMCGGIVLSVSSNEAARSRTLEQLKYQGARILAYTLVGLVLGALGAALSLSDAVRGYVPIVSGVFMLIMGVSILFGQSAFTLPKWYTKALGRFYSSNAIVMGAMTALLPCGTMQAVQFYAVAAGSAGKGALAMLVFALGNLPLLLAFGLLSSVFETRKWKWVLPISALLVIFLAVQMIAKGLSIVA